VPTQNPPSTRARCSDRSAPKSFPALRKKGVIRKRTKKIELTEEASYPKKKRKGRTLLKAKIKLQRKKRRVKL
jgi:hypothetical protein